MCYINVLLTYLINYLLTYLLTYTSEGRQPIFVQAVLIVFFVTDLVPSPASVSLVVDHFAAVSKQGKVNRKGKRGFV